MQIGSCGMARKLHALGHGDMCTANSQQHRHVRRLAVSRLMRTLEASAGWLLHIPDACSVECRRLTLNAATRELVSGK